MKKLKNDFYFTRKERISLLYLCIVISLCMFVLFIVNKLDKPKVYSFEELELDTIINNTKAAVYKKRKEIRTGNLKDTEGFLFDPNNISSDSLKLLGIDSYAANNLIKYRNKGGRIKDRNHFYRIFGMEKYAGRLDTLLVFNDKAETNSKKSFEPKEVNEDKSSTIKSNPISVVTLKTIDINKSDSFELMTLKGIGIVLAKRIINYRNALGGYCDVEQLEEVFGMKPETFMDINHLIYVDKSSVRKININAITYEELEKHPYFSKKQASIVVKYRSNHDKFRSIEDFKKIKIFNDEELEKIEWYLEF